MKSRYEHSREVILNSTALRAQGRYDEAIANIQRHIAELDEPLVFNGRLEIFYSAVKKGDVALARATARQLATEHPDLPTIQSYL